MDVLSLSRQPIRLRFSDEDEEVGTVAIKAGQVLEAEDFRTRTTGADALRELASDPGTAFAVIELPRSSPEVYAATAIGKLGELLANSGAGHGNNPPAPSPLPASAPAQLGEVIMSGETSDVGLDEILEVLPLRQSKVLVSFTRNGVQVGTLSLMSGQVLGATAGTLRGIEAFSQLHADHGNRFEVRRVTVSDAAESMGSVAKLLADVREAAPSVSVAAHREGTRSGRSLFMQGRFSDFPLAMLIDSLELCRQTIELEFRRDDKILHRVLARSGRIIAAITASAKGADAALAAIREDPGSLFLVFRRRGVNVGQPIANLRGLVPDTEAIPGSAESLPVEPDGPIGDPATSPRGETGTVADDLPGIAAQLKQVGADVAALRAAVNALRNDFDRAKVAHLLSRITIVETKLRRELKRSHTSMIEELRTEFSAAKPGRGERILLMCILAVQLGTLAAFAGLVVLVM